MSSKVRFRRGLLKCLYFINCHSAISKNPADWHFGKMYSFWAYILRKLKKKESLLIFTASHAIICLLIISQEAAFSVCLVLEVGRCLQTPINFFFYVVFIISLFVTQVPAGCGFHLSKSLFFRFGKVHVRHHQNKVLASWKCFF